MLRLDSLPGSLLKGLLEMSFEDYKTLEHLDHQVVGIKPVLKLLKSEEKSSNSVSFLES